MKHFITKDNTMHCFCHAEMKIHIDLKSKMYWTLDKMIHFVTG